MNIAHVNCKHTANKDNGFGKHRPSKKAHHKTEQ